MGRDLGGPTFSQNVSFLAPTEGSIPPTDSRLFSLCDTGNTPHYCAPYVRLGGVRIPNIVARTNKYVTNPLQNTWAPKLKPWAVVHHVGRKSGTEYSNPVMAWVERGKVSIPIAYGVKSDWVKNVLAAGQFTLVQGGKTLTIAGPRIVPSDSPDIAKAARVVGKPLEGVLYGRVVSDGKQTGDKQ